MIDEFVAMVAETAVSSHIYNQYAGDTAAAAVCRRNLAAYLRVMQAQRPTVLLLGEAAGYRGCRLTGVPFTSEAVLLGENGRFPTPPPSPKRTNGRPFAAKPVPPLSGKRWPNVPRCPSFGMRYPFTPTNPAGRTLTAPPKHQN